LKNATYGGGIEYDGTGTSSLTRVIEDEVASAAESRLRRRLSSGSPIAARLFASHYFAPY
jgi:hypothetical protein